MKSVCGEERRLDSEGLMDHGEKQREVEFNLESSAFSNVSNTKESLAEVTSCYCKNS